MAKQPQSFKVFKDSKIPVSKRLGGVWKDRRNEAIKVRETKNEPAWQEAIRYYNHHQLRRKDRVGPDYDSSANQNLASRHLDYTENVVFSTVNALVPHVYMKNPQVEVSSLHPNNEDMHRQATIAERLINVLGQRKASPGFNYKPKAKRSVVVAELCNLAWIEVGYTRKEESSEQALIDLQEATKRYEKASTTKEIEEVEGILEALEEKVSLLRPSGPWAKFRQPTQVLRDPTSEDDDASDAKWMMVWDYVRTSYLQAVFMDKNKDTGEFRSIYEPTHLLQPSKEGDGHEDNLDNFSLLGDQKKYQDYGFNSEEEYNRSQFTKVWYVWDKTTRRVLMFHDKNWMWPIWVWDDPYQLDTFFPFEPLTLYTNPIPGESRGEVSYYLDQQDEINTINSEKRKARNWIRKKFLFNKNVISKEDVEAWIRAPDESATGLDLPPDAKLGDAVGTVTPPSMKFPELFDKSDEYQQIDRISAINDILRGAQFKTNTTNQAIDTYSSVQSSRLDEQIDAVEDQTAGVYWKILQMCLQFMDTATVVGLIGEEANEVWRQMSPQEINQSMSLRVIGGSSIKPTSQVKKAQAIEIGQVLGQFASASPVSVLIALKVFEKAYDEIVVTEEDWRMIRQSIEQQLAPQGAGPGAEGDGGSDQAIAQAAQIVDQLPEPAKRALGQAIAQGVPLIEAVQAIIAEMEGASQGPEQDQPPLRGVA